MERIQIPIEHSAHSPAVYAASGAALSYYGYHNLIAHNSIASDGSGFPLLVLYVFLSLVLSLARVLSSSPFLFASSQKTQAQVPRIISKANILLCAGFVGLCLGFTARILLPGSAEIAMPHDRVTGLSGILSGDPRAFNDGRGMGAMELVQAAGIGGIRVSARGKLTVFFPAEAIPRLKEFGRGSEIYVEGVLISRNQISGNQGSSNGELLFRASSVHVLRPAPALDQFRTGFRMAAMEKFGIQAGSNTGGNTSAKPPPWGGLASALLLGIRDNLDSDLTQVFNKAGCAHVLALSGMHLAILSSVIAFLLRLCMGIRPASLISAVFVVVYIFLAGSQPSLVRAGIIFLLGTLALLGYLKRNALSLLAMAFILQIFIQKESGISISFILSYLALIGILWTGESIHELLRGRVPEILNRSLSASLGAVIATLAVTAFYFGEIHPIGIIASIIVMPVASVFMVLSFGSLILISIIPFLFTPLNVVLTIVFKLLEFFVNAAGKVPGFSIPSFIPVIAVSAGLVFLLEYLKYRDRIYRRSIASIDIR